MVQKRQFISTPILYDVISVTASDSGNDTDGCVDDASCTASADRRCCCPCWSTGRRCVRSCDGLPDGDYQSCVCCHGDRAYVSCSGGIFYYMPCPANLVWTDDRKICDWVSRTCTECAWVSAINLTRIKSNNISFADG